MKIKNLYTCAALGLLLTACSADAVTELPVQNQLSVQAQSQPQLIGLIAEIEKNCTQTEYAHTDELIRYVESVAFANPAFARLAAEEYTPPTAEELYGVVNAETAAVIEQLEYSETAKAYLYQLLVTQEPWNTNLATDTELSAKERELLQLCLDYKYDPDNWDGKKPLALAYGYQSGKAGAVVWAVAAGQLHKTEKK